MCQEPCLTFFYTVSLLTLTQLCQAGTIIIPAPQTRKLRDTHGGFPRSHSQPVGSDPSLCPCNHYAMLLPGVPTQPLSTVTPFAKPQVPGGHSVWGHWDTLFDCNLLELLSKPWVVGVSAWSSPAQGVHSRLGHSGQSSPPGGRGFWRGFMETCFLWS